MVAKKIIVEKEEGVGEVVDRILGEPDSALTLVVPRGSTLGKSARNFHLIEREAADAGKEISVESVDENILAFAKNAGMSVGHPLLRERSTSEISGISDIIPVFRHEQGSEEGEGRSGAVPEADKKSRGRKHTAASRPEVAASTFSLETAEEARESTVDEATGMSEEIREEGQSFLREEDRFFKKRPLSANLDTDEDEEEPPRRVLTARRVGWTIAALVVIVAALYGMTAFFGSAKINITFKKTPWGYSGNFTADKTASQINAANNVIPAQVFSVPKNFTKLFPASGEQNVSLKAQGTITIYNAYSSSPQSLVATTRFVTPAGKIFRLVSSVVVPGAAVTNGSIVPSSITAAVIADQAGSGYNVSSTPKLTIPGFEGTPKYNAFYGSLAGGTSGGFIGQKAVPTAADVTAAKQAMTSALTSSLDPGNVLTGTYTNNFKILNGATSIQITKLTVNTSTDATGHFSVYGEGTLSAIGFDETVFKAFLLSLAQPTEASSTFSSLTLTYSTATPVFASGKLGFSINAQGSLEPAFSSDDFRQEIAGQTINAAKDAISSLRELQEGTIAVWPAWLWQIPGNTNKIQVTVN